MHLSYQPKSRRFAVERSVTSLQTLCHHKHYRKWNNLRANYKLPLKASENTGFNVASLCLFHLFDIWSIIDQHHTVSNLPMSYFKIKSYFHSSHIHINTKKIKKKSYHALLHELCCLLYLKYTWKTSIFNHFYTNLSIVSFTVNLPSCTIGTYTFNPIKWDLSQPAKPDPFILWVIVASRINGQRCTSCLSYTGSQLSLAQWKHDLIMLIMT